VFEWLKGKFSRDKPPTNNLYRYSGFPFFFGKSASGKFVNENSALQCTAVYACVRIIAESIASLPLHVYQYKDGGKEKAINHALYFLLHDAPNDEMTSFTFRETSVAHLLLWGNSYAQILRDGLGRVIGLYPLMPNQMSVERDDDGKIYYRYTRNGGEKSQDKKEFQIIFPAKDILHIHGLGFNGLIGFSPIAMARNAIGTTLAVEEFGAKFFENGARPSGILKHPGVLKNPQKLSESWQKIYGGSENVGKVPVLEEGVTFEKISIPPDDAQFIDSRKFQIAEIARIFRIPLHFLNELDRATFNNIEQQSLEYVKYTLTPWLVRWEQTLNKTLLLPSERNKYFIKFNVDGLLRGDYSSRVEGYCKLIQHGVMSINDVREFEDLNPVSDEEGGNLHIVNGNFMKLQQAGAAYENKKTTTQAAE